MATTSPQTLLERLSQHQEKEREGERHRIQKLLDFHEKSMTDLSNHARSTTESVSQQGVQELEKAMAGARGVVASGAKSIKSELKQLDADLQDLGETTRRRMAWMMLWPAVSMILICLFLVAGSMAWSAWKVSQAEVLLAQKQQQIQQLEAQFCASPAGRGICK